MQVLLVVFLCVVCAVVYGVVHDQVTARVCLEYFTIGHPRIIASEDPAVLGLVWGVIATWWVGVLLGVPLAICARAGQRAKWTAWRLVRPIGALLLVMGLVALIGGVVGYGLARSGSVFLIEPLASRVPPEKHVRFIAVGAAHLASYGAGFVGGIVLCAWTYRRRGRGRDGASGE